MVVSILRQRCLELYSKLPVADHSKEQYFFPKILSSYIFTSDFKGEITQLSLNVVDWIQQMGLGSLIFLGDSKMPWLSQESETKEVKEAFQYFNSLDIDTAFNGGWVVDYEDLAKFIKYLYWLTRFNAAFPIVYFTDKRQGLIGNICKYGNLYIYTLSEDIDHIILAITNQSKFVRIEGEQC
jgi:hypothetical protein